HEQTFFSRDGARARAAPWIDQKLMEFLGAQPTTLRTNADGKRIFVVHASPWEPNQEYLFPHSPTLRRFGEFDADIVILGHTHHKMALRMGGRLLINSGSAGQARDPANGFQLSYALLDTETEEVSFHDYADPAREAFLRAARAGGAA